ncbi:MAG TPA: phosphatase PAP2 family protein [Myxococcales bacterium]|nr:phosphatase PAP2 family protein [Myxococcales bacterium]
MSTSAERAIAAIASPAASATSALSWITRLDEEIFLRVGALRPRWLVRLMRSLTHLGDPTGWVAIGLFLGCAGPQGPRRALLLGAGALLATLLSQFLKRWCRRPRPSAGLLQFVALVENPDAFSFPSGHTSAAFAVAVALSGQGAGLGPLSLGLACAIGFSRIYLGAHYPLDVMTGALLGCIAGGAARIVFL